MWSQKSVTAEQMLGLVADALEENGIVRDRLVGMVYDRASVNVRVYNDMKTYWKYTAGIGCVSHTLNNVGNKFKAPLAKRFMKHWRKLLKSNKAKLLFQEQCPDITLKSFSKTRWWSWWEVLYQVVILFGDVWKFIWRNDLDVCPKSIQKLRQLLGPVNLPRLLIEWSVIAEVGRPLVTATYNLEGDGPIVLSIFCMIQEAKHRVDSHKLPQTVVVAVRLARPGPGITAMCEQVQLVNYANEVYAPAKRYLHDILLNQLMPCVRPAYRPADERALSRPAT